MSQQHSFILFISLLLSFVCFCYSDSTSPDLVIEIFRHGARGPLSLKYDQTWDPSLLGELTPAGARMHYLLGAALAEKYPEILGQTFDRKKIYARTSQTERCVESATAQFYGAFQGVGPTLADDYPVDVAVPPYDADIIANLLKNMNYSQALPGGFTPIVLNSLPSDQDVVLETPGTCPALYIDALTNVVSKDSLGFWKEDLVPTRDILDSLGMPAKNPFVMQRIADALICDYFQNKEIPGNITFQSDLWKNITFAGYYYTVLGVYGSPRQKQLLSVPLFDEVFGYLDAKANGTTPVEFVFLSTHDTTQLTILTALDIVSKECLLANYRSDRLGEPLPYPNCFYPPFASTIIFELFNNGGSPYVVFKYNDQPIPLCQGATECPLGDFKEVVKQATNGYTVQDYKRECLNGVVKDVNEIIKEIEHIFDPSAPLDQMNVEEDKYLFHHQIFNDFPKDPREEIIFI